MDFVELVRIGIRRRIVGNIVEQGAYQRQWMDDSPQDADLYIRETVIESAKTEISQQRTKITALVELDVFVRRNAFPNPLAVASDYADRIFREFNPKDNRKIVLTLDDGSTAYIQQMPYQDAPTQEEELLNLPVLFTVGGYV